MCEFYEIRDFRLCTVALPRPRTMSITTEEMNKWKKYDEVMMNYGFYLKHGSPVQ